MRSANRKSNLDVGVKHGGTIVEFHLLTEAAREWVSENVQAESWQFLGITLCVEPRYADNLIAGMVDAGLDVF